MKNLPKSFCHRAKLSLAYVCDECAAACMTPKKYKAEIARLKKLYRKK